MPQTGILNLRILLSLQLLLIDSNKLFAPPRVFSKAIVRDPIKPRGEARFTTKAADVLVSPQESFLRQIICECDVRSCELSQQASHSRLMPPDQFAESMLIIINKNPRDKVCIG